MKKICLTCKHAKYHDSVLLLCIEDVEFSTPIAVEHNFNCKNYNKLSNKGIIKRLAEIHGIESHKYNEDDDYICEIDFDKDEGFHISIPGIVNDPASPVVVNGIRKYKKGEIYYDEYDANFLVNKLDDLLEDKE